MHTIFGKDVLTDNTPDSLNILLKICQNGRWDSILSAFTKMRGGFIDLATIGLHLKLLF